MLRVLRSDDIEGKRVLVRVDFNVAVEHEKVTDDFRIRATLPTLRFLRRSGASAIFLLAHRGRPKGIRDANLSLAPVADHFRKLWDGPVQFSPECVGGAAEEMVKKAAPGTVILFENLRFHEGEEQNDKMFARSLARLGDYYVNDAFGDAHRAHASIVTLPTLLPSAAGLLLQREAVTLAHIRDNPRRPFVVVLGGAKVADKVLLVEKLLPKVSDICLGGVLANTVLKAQGVAIGKSVVDDTILDRIQAIVITDTKLHLPVDVLVSSDLSGGGPTHVRAVGDVADDELILDIGPETQKLFNRVITQAKTVFWNGPVGLAERAVFRKGTEAVAKSIAAASAFSVIGGGDTTRYPIELGLAEKIGFLSTGGGAMLEYLSGGTLPGLTALQENQG